MNHTIDDHIQSAWMFQLIRNWIPHPFEPKALKIRWVGGRKLSHPKSAKTEGSTCVVDAAARVVARCCILPKFGVEFPTVGRETQNPPARMPTVTLDYIDGFGGGQWLDQNHRIAQKQVVFGEHEFTQSYVVSIGHRFNETTSGFMARRSFAETVKKQIRVDGKHGRMTLDSRQVRISIGESSLPKFLRTQAFPTNPIGSRWGPVSGRWFGCLRIHLKEQLCSPAKGFRHRPLTLLCKTAQFPKQLFRHLNLSFYHTGYNPSPSN